MSQAAIERVARRLFTDDLDRAKSFVSCVTSESSSAQAIVWVHGSPEQQFQELSRTVWQPNFVQVIASEEQPGIAAEHFEGKYYCCDLSSVFMAAVFCHPPLVRYFAETQDSLVLDICAAPGGKSILAWRTLHPQLLITNETIHKRLAALISNLKRCHIRPVEVSGFDPRGLTPFLQNTAALVIVDAPCSGQSLVARGVGEQGAFHPVTISRNAGRQKRILAESAACVRPGGYLAYMTCTFSKEENEEVLTWFLKRFPEFESCAVETLATHQSELTTTPCYRLFPMSAHGSGGFTSLLRRSSVSVTLEPESRSEGGAFQGFPKPLWKSE